MILISLLVGPLEYHGYWIDLSFKVTGGFSRLVLPYNWSWDFGRKKGYPAEVGIKLYIEMLSTSRQFRRNSDAKRLDPKNKNKKNKVDSKINPLGTFGPQSIPCLDWCRDKRDWLLVIGHIWFCVPSHLRRKYRPNISGDPHSMPPLGSLDLWKRQALQRPGKEGSVFGVKRVKHGRFPPLGTLGNLR